MAKNVLDNKVTATGISFAGTAVPALRFLQAEKQKQV